MKRTYKSFYVILLGLLVASCSSIPLFFNYYGSLDVATGSSSSSAYDPFGKVDKEEDSEEYIYKMALTVTPSNATVEVTSSSASYDSYVEDGVLMYVFKISAQFYVSVSHDGYVSEEHRIEVYRSSAEYSINLSQKPKLTITTSPAGSDVSIYGYSGSPELSGRDNCEKIFTMDTFDIYKATISHEGYQEEVVDINVGGDVSKYVELTPLSGDEPPNLSVTVSPADAIVEIGAYSGSITNSSSSENKDEGTKTILYKFSEPNSTVSVKVSHKDYTTVTAATAVPRGTKYLTIKLGIQPVLLVYTEPADADVVVYNGNDRVGTEISNSDDFDPAIKMYKFNYTQKVRIEVSHKDYVTSKQEDIELYKGSTHMVVSLDKKPTLTVTTDPADATVYIDEYSSRSENGAVKTYVLNDFGVHKVSVSYTGYSTKVLDVDVQEASTSCTVKLNLASEENIAIEDLISKTTWNTFFPQRWGVGAVWKEDYQAKDTYYDAMQTDIFSYENFVEAVNSLQDIQISCSGGRAVKVSYDNGESWYSAYSYEAPQRVDTIKMRDFLNKPGTTLDEKLRELAAFLAHISYETRKEISGQYRGLYYRENLAYEEGTGDYTDYRDESFKGIILRHGTTTTPYCPKILNDPCYYPEGHPKYGNGKVVKYEMKSYHGRGAMQMQDASNYALVSRILYKTSSELLNSPEKLVEDGVAAFKTAILLWMTPRYGSAPSAHEVMYKDFLPGNNQLPDWGIPEWGIGHAMILMDTSKHTFEAQTYSSDSRVKIRIDFYNVFLSAFGLTATTAAIGDNGEILYTWRVERY